MLAKKIEDLEIPTDLIKREMYVTPSFIQLHSWFKLHGFEGDEGIFASIVAEEWAQKVKGLEWAFVHMS